MAENDNIFQQLGKLFQSNVVIRKREDGKLMVKDLDYSQTALKSNFIERYTRLMQNTYSNPYSSCLLYTSPSPRDRQKSRMPSSA